MFLSYCNNILRCNLGKQSPVRKNLQGIIYQDGLDNFDPSVAATYLIVPFGITSTPASLRRYVHVNVSCALIHAVDNIQDCI